MYYIINIRLYSEEDAKVAARRIARLLQRMGYKVRLANFRVVNVLGTCTFPFAIRITTFSSNHKEARYVGESYKLSAYVLRTAIIVKKPRLNLESYRP